MSEHVRIVMVEDDEGHARLIEKNIRRAGVRNEIIGFENGTKAVEFLFGSDGSGKVNSGNALLIMLDEPQATPESHGYATSGWNAVPVGGALVTRIAPLLGMEPRFELAAADKQILSGAGR